MSGIWFVTLTLGRTTKNIIYKPSSMLVDFMVMGDHEHLKRQDWNLYSGYKMENSFYERVN